VISRGWDTLLRVTMLPPAAPGEFAGPPAEPAELLRRWLADARAAGEADPSTAVLATADASGQPSTRCLAVRSCDERGLVMFTNLDTRKGRDLRANPRAAVTLYWPALFRQVNITGHVELTGEDESDTLWEARGLPGQVASTVSRHSAGAGDSRVLARAPACFTTACITPVPARAGSPGSSSRNRLRHKQPIAQT
jgi:pyridoxamine 5'-phosphate oxidase